ncbi:acetylornithine deacetylase [Mycolicibacterium baixiangningiae]|uniref:acetylornithine deacetylase n=1 Tax=Mycolicibacterium baixiangningiae TaxID=2761578 RepID=UPI0018692D86|nr:acetylornithine deacetylase [Mycolicibacterium baixiangningiae]
MTDELTSLQWIKELVAIDSTSDRSNLPILELIDTQLRKAGARTAFRPNQHRNKANLVASFPSADGSLAGGLVLSGHTDAVPVEGQDWTSDPYTAEVKDGRIYGRGTADMKGFIGAALSVVPRIQQAQLREPIHYVLSYDEEIGLHGGAQIASDLQELGLSPRHCVVGEPTGMQAVRAHKSFSLASISVRGVDGHSSRAPHLVNAAFYGAQLVGFIEQLAKEFEDHGPFDSTYDVPFSTISVNQILSGNASNTVPALCQIRLDLRTIPAMPPLQVLDRVRAHAQTLEKQMQDLDITVEAIALAPGLDTSPRSTLLAALNDAGVSSGGSVAYGTEAGFFDAAGIETVVCGPGSIAQAHIADEYVAIEQIAECERVLGALIDTYCEV